MPKLPELQLDRVRIEWGSSEAVVQLRRSKMRRPIKDDCKLKTFHSNSLTEEQWSSICELLIEGEILIFEATLKIERRKLSSGLPSSGNRLGLNHPTWILFPVPARTCFCLNINTRLYCLKIFRKQNSPNSIWPIPVKLEWHLGIYSWNLQLEDLVRFLFS